MPWWAETYFIGIPVVYFTLGLIDWQWKRRHGLMGHKVWPMADLLMVSLSWPIFLGYAAYRRCCGR